VTLTQGGSFWERRAVAEGADTDVLAFVEPGGTASDNLLSATLPFFARGEIGGVVVSNVAPVGGSLLHRAAAAIRESRFGGGSQYYRFMPGNIRYVRGFRSSSYLVRRTSFLRLPTGLTAEDVPGALSEAGERVLYTPEAVVVATAAPLYRSHLAHAFSEGRARAGAVRRRGPRGMASSTAFALAAAAFLSLGWLLALAGDEGFDAWLAAVVAYGAAIAAHAVSAGIRQRSARLGVLVLSGLVLTHAVYVGGFVLGWLRR